MRARVQQVLRDYAVLLPGKYICIHNRSTGTLLDEQKNTRRSVKNYIALAKGTRRNDKPKPHSYH